MRSLLKTLRLDFRIKVGYGAAFILLLISYVLTLIANKDLRRQSEEVLHTNRVITHLTELISYVKDAETGVRGYIIRNDSSFLEPYEKSIPLVKNTFDMLKDETVENADQQVLLYRVKGLIDEKYILLETGISNFVKNNYRIPDSSMHTTPAGKIVMDSIRSAADVMKNAEQRILDSRTKKFQDQSW